MSISYHLMLAYNAMHRWLWTDSFGGRWVCQVCLCFYPHCECERKHEVAVLYFGRTQ